MLITPSYFIGDNDIPNNTYAEVQSSVEWLIGNREPEYLKYILGPELYELFKVGIAAGSPAQIWLDIRDGKTYTSIDGRDKSWQGLVNATTFNSPIADYCYYWWLRANVSATTGVGEVENTVMNASMTNSRRKQAEAWNRMVEKNYYLFDFLRSNQEVYPEYDYLQYGMSCEGRNLHKKINAYNF